MSYNKTYIGDKAGSFTTATKDAAITGVNIHMDNDTEVFVGEEGNVLEVNLPVCNSTEDAQSYGQYILNALANYQYQPYTAGKALLNPAFQLGDGVTVKSTYSGIYTRKTTLGRLTRADIAAPYTEEVENEYPYQKGTQSISYRKYTRLEANMESEFSIQADQISAKVSQLSPDGQTAFSWSLTSSGHYWYNNGTEVMSITSGGLTVKGRITALSGYIGDETNGFTVGSTSISNGKTSLSDSNAGVYIGTDGIALGSASSFNDTSSSNHAFQVDSSGNVTVKNLTVLGGINYKDSSSATASYKGSSASAYGIGGGGTYQNKITSRGYQGEIAATYLYIQFNGYWYGVGMDSSGYLRVD